MHRSALPVLAALGVLAPSRSAAQSWNDSAAVALALRATARRDQAAQDTLLRDYHAQAHGFVFFLGQFGDGASPPRLIKADQLALEVYWKAPRSSKQRIVGWRDQAEMPTDINYHIDHLGIVQNNFGPAIRIGDGDEVQDVPHPLSPGATARYEYALGDTLTIHLAERDVRVATLLVRPAPGATGPAVAGTLYLDVATADLVRMAFSFTRASYVDKELEDVSIVLENALWEGRFWLPQRQEIEIRRRATWLDIPVRGIIRGRWEVGSYAFNTGLDERWFTGPEITAAPRAERDAYPWDQPLAAAIQGVAEPVRQNDLEAVRSEVARVAGRRAVSGLRARRLGARSLSDLVHANRVQGLTLGAGFTLRVQGGLEARVFADYGTGDGSPSGIVALTDAVAGWHFELAGYREVRDIADAPVVAPLVNSFASQEWGDDYGDYYRAEGGRAAVGHLISPRAEWNLALMRETPRSLMVHGAPANGRFRPNQLLGGRPITRSELVLRRASGGFAVRRDWNAEAALEVGAADGVDAYARVRLSGQALVPLGATRVQLRAEAGAASENVPAYRAFLMGGHGTLLGEDFRRFGGREAVLVHGEWRVPVKGVTLGVGSFARVPTSLTVAPFVAAGWVGASLTGATWLVTGDTRVTVGLALEWLGLIRVEAGYGLASKNLRFSFDLTRDFWPIL